MSCCFVPPPSSRSRKNHRERRRPISPLERHRGQYRPPTPYPHELLPHRSAGGRNLYIRPRTAKTTTVVRRSPGQRPLLVEVGHRPRASVPDRVYYYEQDPRSSTVPSPNYGPYHQGRPDRSSRVHKERRGDRRSRLTETKAPRRKTVAFREPLEEDITELIAAQNARIARRQSLRGPKTDDISSRLSHLELRPRRG